MKHLIIALVLAPLVGAAQNAPDFTLARALELLPAHSTGYFATIDGDKPDLRGWQFQCYENGKFVFATSNEKAVFRQISKNPNVAFACAAGEYHFRISGRAAFVSAAEKKRLFAKLSPPVQKMYGSADNASLVIFTVAGGTLRVAQGFGAFQTIKY
ncbi:MAG: pyridoxamine 5'-phosphate oxidase family protein [Prevotellaceae bacterium]|jgi:uncharacterized pyridoxamine 5'-phosphate oxidase family protein|nr:pyridoxamine 5'-phosphate oxidase family protein [Prevotellaceae bacterium]